MAINVTRRWLGNLLHLVVPANCLFCHARLEQVSDSLGLCLPCRGRLKPWSAHSCFVCRRLLETPNLPPGYRCGSCRRNPPAYDGMLCGWSYTDPLTEVITGLKFRHLEYLGPQIGRQLAKRFAADIVSCDLVTAVPLHWSRHLQRGYDQGQGIARAVARRSGLPYASALRRRRATPPQSRLQRADRTRNLRGAFGWRSRRLLGCHVLLVDDVATTGATLWAAAEALKSGGAARVTALVAAKTPAEATNTNHRRTEV